jgi:hypothetical protein
MVFTAVYVTLHYITAFRMSHRFEVAKITDLVGKPEGRRPLGRSRRMWEGNIKLYLREIGIDGANWIRLAQDKIQWRAFVNTLMNLRVP